jgi:hypothetical protein
MRLLVGLHHNTVALQHHISEMKLLVGLPDNPAALMWSSC